MGHGSLAKGGRGRAPRSGAGPGAPPGPMAMSHEPPGPSPHWPGAMSHEPLMIDWKKIIIRRTMLLLTRIMAFINRWWDFHYPWKSYEDFSLVRKTPVKYIYIYIFVPSCLYIYTYIFRATPSAAAPVQVLSCNFGGLVPPFLNPEDHLHLGSTLGDHFGTPGPPWRTMEAAGRTRGCPEQDFHIFWNDFGTLFLQLFGHRGSGLFPGLFFFINFLIEMSTLAAPNSRFAHGKVAHTNFSWKSLFIDFGADLCCLLEALGPFCLVFATLETGFKIDGLRSESDEVK